jgi:ATP-dependent helicase/nuclease subunit B
MLEIIKVQRRSDIVQQFASFDAKAQSWLVSDLRTKLEIQNRLLEKDHFFADNSILRATDLWRLCYRREFPKKQLIERSWARVLISNFLKMNIS